MSPPSLHEDLVSVVLGFLYEYDYHDAKLLRKHFDSYSRIARVWRRPAQVLLFHHVELHGPSFLSIARGMNESVGSLSLLMRVRVLSLHSRCMPTPNPLVRSYRQLGTAMRLFPLLYELRLHWLGPPPDAQDLLELQETPRIVSLRLTVAEADPNVILPLLTAWSLRHLFLSARLAHTSPGWDERALEPFIPSVRFEELGLESPKHGTIPKLFSWILRHSASHVRILHLAWASSPSPPIPTSFVQSLTLRPCSLLTQIRGMTALIDLTLLVEDVVRSCANTTLQAFLIAMPISLRFFCLAFRPFERPASWSRSVVSFLERVCQKMAEGQPAKLETVICEGLYDVEQGDWCLDRDVMRNLRSLYASRHVQLTFEPHTLEPIDAVPFLGFPRRDILRNIATMNQVVNTEAH